MAARGGRRREAGQRRDSALLLLELCLLTALRLHLDREWRGAGAAWPLYTPRPIVSVGITNHD
jgi:hypothetical protein